MTWFRHLASNLWDSLTNKMNLRHQISIWIKFRGFIQVIYTKSHRVLKTHFIHYPSSLVFGWHLEGSSGDLPSCQSPVLVHLSQNPSLVSHLSQLFKKLWFVKTGRTSQFLEHLFGGCRHPQIFTIYEKPLCAFVILTDCLVNMFLDDEYVWMYSLVCLHCVMTAPAVDHVS